MDRRELDRAELLKKAGVGTALASFPLLTEVAWADDADDDFEGWRRGFHFVALSGVEDSVTGGDSIAMAGCGRFNPAGRRVRGGGKFVHFDGTNFGTPDNIIGTGHWRATRLISFQEIGTWGAGVAGILEMRARLIPCEGRVIRGARIKVVCNLSPAGIITSPFQQEGFTLTLPSGVTFSPFTPNIGLTLFTRRCREVD
jgi:hypothetical protein